jgi:dephospho-CoA kinase
MKKVLIFILGLPGSGKSLAADALRKRFHAKVFKPGDIIREEVKRRGWANTPDNDRKVSMWFHRGREHLIARRIWGKIRKENGMIIIDGLRTPTHLSVLRRLYKGQVIIIKMQSSFNIRSKRTISRGRFGKLESAANLKARDAREMRNLSGLGYLMKRADYTINNSKLTRRQMEKKVVELAETILR